MDDATVAVEVAACEALVQWPYLSDLTLIWALASIFLLPPPVSALSQTPVSADRQTFVVTCCLASCQA